LNATTRVLIGLVLGALAGLALDAYDSAVAVKVADWIQPLGRLWLNALQMTVVTITIVPVLIAYPFVQKHFTKGVLIGAIKG